MIKQATKLHDSVYLTTRCELQYGITWKNIAHYFVFSFRMHLTKLPIIVYVY